MAFRETTMSEHAKKVLRWRDSFLDLDVNRFSEIMRMYLGEIKTPFNKQKLIASLEGFLHQKEHLVAIKSLVTPEELEIICAAVFIPDCTEEKLTHFFENTFSFSFIYETVLNLEERLILFVSKNEDKSIIEFNPLLEDAFYDLITVEKLLPKINFKEIRDEQVVITPEFIAAFVSFVLENPNLSKQDRSLKKHTLEIAEEIFSRHSVIMPVVFNAFLNLGVLKESGRGVEFDWNKLDKFVQQSFVEQLIYIVVTSAGHFSRDNLKLQAQLFVDTVRNLEGISFTKDLFLRTGFLAAARPKAQDDVRSLGSSRFAKILEENRARMAQENGESVRISESGGLERMFDAACTLGILTVSGITDDKQKVYVVNQILSNANILSAQDRGLSGMLTPDPGLAVSLMPGFALKDIIPVMRFMSVARYDMVSSFTIDRQSIMRGFDFGLTAKSILELLNERAAYPIPETMKVQIEDWNSSYSSASLYRGYILKLEGNAAIAAERNSVLAPHIHSVIAPGIFLLDLNDDGEVLSLIKESGLDFVGKIKTPRVENQSTDFFKLNLAGRKINERTGFEEPKEIIETQDPEKITDQMYAALGKLKLDHAMKEGLELRIIHKVIINPEQLNPNVLRMERVDADAMDFGGKVYIIELAMKCQEMIEMSFGSSGLKVVGTPVALTKRLDETFVEITTASGSRTQEYAVGKATSVRRIRKGIYGN